MAHETEKLLHQREEELQSKVKDRDDQLRARGALDSSELCLFSLEELTFSKMRRLNV